MMRVLRLSGCALLVGLCACTADTTPISQPDANTYTPPPTIPPAAPSVDAGISSTGTGGTGSCVGQCGSQNDVGGCYCNTECVQQGDCCADYATACGGGTGGTGSCVGQCGSQNDVGGCYCNTECVQQGDCCADYATACGGGTGGTGGTGSCVGQCGSQNDCGGCYCNTDCLQYGDCCPDYNTACGGF